MVKTRGKALLVALCPLKHTTTMGCEAESRIALNHLLFVYYQFKLHPKPFRRLAAHYHTPEENLKVIHDGTIFRVDIEF